ncbi:hypothetical protein THRCLA_06751 [Thraustotheca clavata]|uniref:FYVE-type domain-containing protein n=1 Tax=Thraustotheca clavata TaxID=74557 RepID=A0A1V9ZJX6_9STRA|nr:hypothetical protein THRCLA_06751 [Thraustotheca clavata]
MEYPHLDLPPNELAHFRQINEEFANKALDVTYNYLRDQHYLRTKGYKLTQDKNGSQTYQRTCPKSSFEEYLMTGVCETTIEELSYGIYTATTQDLRTVFALTFKEDFLDAAILQTCETQTEEDPGHWFGIKYARLQLHSIFHARDTVFSELSGTRKDAKGLRTLFQVRHTIDIPQLPPFPHIVRFDHDMGWLFSELPDGRVQFTIIGHLDPHGKMPAWVFNKMTPKKHASSCTMFSELMRLRRLVEAPRVDAHAVSDDSPKRCTMCTHITKHGKYCRCCGQITCKKCILIVSQPIQVTLDRVDPTKHLKHPMDEAIYCKACFKSPPRLIGSHSISLSKKSEGGELENTRKFIKSSSTDYALVSSSHSSSTTSRQNHSSFASSGRG